MTLLWIVSGVPNTHFQLNHSFSVKPLKRILIYTGQNILCPSCNVPLVTNLFQRNLWTLYEFSVVYRVCTFNKIPQMTSNWEANSSSVFKRCHYKTYKHFTECDCCTRYSFLWQRLNWFLNLYAITYFSLPAKYPQLPYCKKIYIYMTLLCILRIVMDVNFQENSLTHF